MKKTLILISFIFSFASGQNGIISGFVTDSSSGEALIGANIVLTESGQGMATEMNGYYIIQGVAEGTYTLLVSYVGFKTYRAPVSIAAGESKKINVTLAEKMVEMTEVEVTAERLQRRNNIQPSKVNLSPRMMKAAPALAEPDLFRTIQALPGVLTTSEFSTGLVIRGGNTDQNLILLDGITVYNPSHLGGVFSNFIVDGVKEAELIKGGYNAEYGGRLSAVLNVISREGNRKRFKGKANLSLLSPRPPWKVRFTKVPGCFPAAGPILILYCRKCFQRTLLPGSRPTTSMISRAISSLILHRRIGCQSASTMALMISFLTPSAWLPNGATIR